MNIRRASMTYPGGGWHRTSQGNTIRGIGLVKATNIMHRNHKHGQNLNIARRLAPLAIPDSAADEYIFSMNGASVRSDTLGHIISGIMTHEWTLNRSPEDLAALIEKSKLFCRGPNPMDPANATTIISATRTTLPQDAVQNRRCEPLEVILIGGPWVREPVPVDDGDQLLQAFIGADLAIPRKSLNGRVVQVCGYYPGDPRIDLGSGLIDGLGCMQIAAIPSRDEPVFAASNELKALGLLLESQHIKYGGKGEYVIGIRDARFGPLEAYLVNQAMNRQMRLKNGRTISIHVPGDFRSDFIKEIRALNNTEVYHSNPVGSEASFDYAAIRSLYDQQSCDHFI